MIPTPLRRALTALLTVAATLATLVVAAPAAGAAVTAGNSGSAVTSDAYAGNQVAVDPGTVLCDGAPYSGSMEVWADDSYRTTINVAGGTAAPATFGAVATPGTYAVEGWVAGCGGPAKVMVPLGSYTVHNRSTTTTVTTPATIDAGDTLTLTVTVANSGPETPTGTVAVSIDGSMAFPSLPLVDGTVTVTTGTREIAGTFTVEATYYAELPWISSSGTATHTVIPEVTTASVFATPSSAVTGSTQRISVMAEALRNVVDTRYTHYMLFRIDGVPKAQTNVGSSGGGSWAMRSFDINLAGVAPGTRTLTASFPAGGALGASSVSWDIEVTALPSAITASGPLQVDWAEPFSLTATVDPAGSATVDGTVTVYDGATVVGSAPAVRGAVTVPIAGVGVGEDRELTVRHTGATFYDPSETTFTLDVDPAPWNLDIDIATTTAGANAAVTVTATPPAGAPSGTVHWEMDGFALPGFDPATVSSAGWNLVARAGTTTYTAVYTSDRPEFADTTVSKTITVDRTATTTDANLTYTAPSSPGTTGAVTGTICVVADNSAVFTSSYGTGPFELSLTHHDTDTTQNTVAATAVGSPGCVRTAPLVAADLAPGDYTLTATYPGNTTYMEPSSDTFEFTVQQAPTGLALQLSGAPGDTFGMSTLVRATLTEPVPGHTHGGDITFYVNGEAATTATPTDGIAATYLQLPAGDGVEVTASYPGDTVHAAVTSAPLLFDVAQGTVTVKVSATPERVRLGETSTLAATVTIEDPPPVLIGVHAPTVGPVLAAAVGDPADGTVTFYVDGIPVGTETLVDGSASMPYIPSTGTHQVTASYSGAANLAPVSAADVTAVTAVAVPPVVAPPGASGPPTFPPTVPPTFLPALRSAAARGDAPAAAAPATPGGQTAAAMAHTGAESRTFVTFAAVLLAAGIGLLRVRRRPTA